jgi:hypothetical protein
MQFQPDMADMSSFRLQHFQRSKILLRTDDKQP